ncbi:probable UPF0301 protein CT0663 [Coccomyxa sp. Obi]|nr:probable UPF0301 protein CT0663 [Coccomyxa sp. Obi]
MPAMFSMMNTVKSLSLAETSSEDGVTIMQLDRKLAQESIWAHETELPEVGGLLIAQPQIAELTGDPRLWQLVILLVEHGQRTVGLIINRPSSAKVGDLLAWGYSPSQADDANARLIHGAFADCQVYLGAFYPPNRIARQPVTLVHGQGHLQGSKEISPGIYTGGEQQASIEILEGRLDKGKFRFFSGQMQWEPGQLAREIQQGYWYTAACSRSIVLKQCLQLPVPLWKEILLLMGGQYAQIASKRYR